jgi:hypothetical protein
MSRFAVLVTLIAIAIPSAAQRTDFPRFKGHLIGETAEEFFKIARHDETRELSSAWCKSISDRERELESAQAHAKKQGDRKRLIQDLDLLYADVDACKPFNDAVAGKDATAEAILASELGPGGEAVFHNGYLVEISLEVVDSYDHVFADMTKKLGDPTTEQTVTQSDGLQYPESEWTIRDLSAAIEQRPIRPPAPSWVAVTVWDQSWGLAANTKAEKDRKSSLD